MLCQLKTNGMQKEKETIQTTELFNVKVIPEDRHPVAVFPKQVQNKHIFESSNIKDKSVKSSGPPLPSEQIEMFRVTEQKLILYTFTDSSLDGLFSGDKH